MKLTLAILVILLLLLTNCRQPDFEYPQSKIWAHRVNDTATAREKSKKFVGLEVDAIYSEHQDKIFVGHNIEDTANNLQIDEWFMHIDNPSQKCFWIDMKNLDKRNAKAISEKILCIMDIHNMTDNIFVESSDIISLKIIKDSGIRVIFWADNLIWNNLDTASWIEHTKSHIDELKPDAISEESGMFELLTECFPEQNIHLWQASMNPNEVDTATLKKLCGNKSVKVVLVDYDEPIEY